MEHTQQQFDALSTLWDAVLAVVRSPASTTDDICAAFETYRSACAEMGAMLRDEVYA